MTSQPSPPSQPGPPATPGPYGPPAPYGPPGPYPTPVPAGSSTHQDRRPRRWVVAVSVGWAVLLAAAGTWAIANGRPTAREQTTVAEAAGVVDEASARIAVAAGFDGTAVVAVSGFTRFATCRVTAARDGARFRRTVTAVVPPGTEQALLGRVADRLPERYGASVRTGPVPRLSADAGFFVGVTGRVAAPGVVEFVADTGDCRATGDLGDTHRGDLLADGVATAPPSVADQKELTALLDRLGLTVAGWREHRLACPDRGVIRTVVAEAEPVAVAGPLDVTLRPAVGRTAEIVAATERLFAYRDQVTGAESVGRAVAVRDVGGPVLATVTTLCS